MKLRETSAFTHWTKEVNLEQEIEKLSGLEFTGQKQ